MKFLPDSNQGANPHFFLLRLSPFTPDNKLEHPAGSHVPKRFPSYLIFLRGSEAFSFLSLLD